MAEQPKYKLYYFNLYALGEPLRVLFAYGRIKYEDVRIERSQWPALKPTMPLGQMPVLEIDNDKRVYQSMAIARYLAKIVGLSGANDWEDLLIDVVVDTIKDYELKIADAEFDKDENAKQKKYAHCKKEVIPFYMAKLDAIAKENNGYMALGRLTWADIELVTIMDMSNYWLGFDATADYNHLATVRKNVMSVDSIKEWYEKRPKSEAY